MAAVAHHGRPPTAMGHIHSVYIAFKFFLNIEGNSGVYFFLFGGCILIVDGVN